MRLVVFCLAVLSSNSAVVHVVAVPVTMSCPERLEHGASAVVTCMISTAGVDSARCVANPTTVTFSEILPGRPFTSACATSYTTTDCAASNAAANGTCACTGLAGDIKTFTFRFVADKDTHNGAEIKCSVCKSVPPLDIQQNNCKSLTFDIVRAGVSGECPAQFADNKDNAITCTLNKAAIGGVICPVDPRSLQFAFQRRTEPSPATQCLATYPCTSPAPVTATGTCGCTKQEGDIFTYTLLFKANKTTHEGGQFFCDICPSSQPPLSRTSSDSCKSISILKYVISSTTDGDASDEEGSTSSNLGLIIGATAGGVVFFAVAIGTAIYCYKKRSSSGHNVHSNTRSDTPHPAVGTASHPADRGVAATLDVKPTGEEAGENDSEASEATDYSETSEEP